MYLGRVVPPEDSGKSLVLGHPVPTVTGEGYSVDPPARLLLLVRGKDWAKFERALLDAYYTASDYGVELAAAGAYQYCVSFNKKMSTSIRCIPPVPPSRLARETGAASAAVLLRTPSGSVGKVLFPTQLFEAFNPATPVAAARQDFIYATRLARQAVAKILEAPVVGRNELRAVVEAVARGDVGFWPEGWEEGYRGFYERYNARAWLERLLREV